jgi:site-specific recombinase XerD
VTEERTEIREKPLSLWQLHERLWSSCRRAGLRRIRWHDCRHSFASQLVMASTPLRQVQEWLGHSTIMMTMRYSHLAPGGGREFLSALDGENLRQSNGSSGGVAGQPVRMIQ